MLASRHPQNEVLVHSSGLDFLLSSQLCQQRTNVHSVSAILVSVHPQVTPHISSHGLSWHFFVIDTRKSVPFLNLNNELSETEIVKISLRIASKTIECLEINLSKTVKDLYTEN